MRKKNLLLACAAVCVMLLLPWCAVRFVNPKSGMLISMLLFFGVNPVYAVITGWTAGKWGKAVMVQPLLCGMLFLLGAWLILQTGERVFCWYAVGYVVLGYAAAGISHLARKIK